MEKNRRTSQSDHHGGWNKPMHLIEAPDPCRSCAGQQSRPIQTGAHDVVRTVLGDLKERQGITEPVALEPGCLQNWILESNCQGRVVSPHERAFSLWRILDLAKRTEPAIGIPVERLGPALQALAAG
jgi:hypothetical protein